MIMDVNMDVRDQALLNKILKENSDQTVRHNLIKKYNLYYNYWLDYQILVTFFAMMGLILNLIEWEVNYP